MRFTPSLLLIISLAAGPALASPKKHKALTAVAKLAPPAPRPAPVAAPVTGLPRPALPGAVFAPGGLATNALALRGLRSPLPPIGDTTAQCRDTCAHARLTCDAQDGSVDCSSRWAICTSDCAR